MTREALEKEAIQYAVDYPTSYGKGYKHKDLRIAYLAGAEPREKQLTKAKELLKDTLLMAQVEGLKGRYETVDEIEQFLKEE